MNIENIDIKDLVLIGGGLFTLAIIVHGIWLAWRSRQEPLRLEISPDLIPEDDDDLSRLRGELPNGGGRFVRPLQKDLDFDEAVPVLLDPVIAPLPEAAEPVADASQWPETEPADASEHGFVEEEPSPIRAGGAEPDLPDTGPIIAQDPNRSRFGERKEPEQPGETRQAPPDTGGQELLVINLFAREGEQFTGEAMLASMRARGLKFGEMNIFHRLDPVTREVRFSVANVVEPGYFDLAEIADFVSPGLVFFLQLPGPEHPGETVEDMIRIARNIADDLGAVLKDENMNDLTPQTAEHYRERVADFSRRRLSRRVGAA
ncbi:MAG: cell division protein ZipA [Gammaproteobacteria bacterium]|nr:cell division protein ZipA [Gammaproteobacteria bacterium]